MLFWVSLLVVVKNEELRIKLDGPIQSVKMLNNERQRPENKGSAVTLPGLASGEFYSQEIVTYSNLALPQ